MCISPVERLSRVSVESLESGVAGTKEPPTVAEI
jgi:hypothetical protein